MKAIPVYKNILANYAGAVVTTLIAFFLTPVYISYIGVSSYGVIAFYVSLQALFSFLDLGIGMSVNREMASHYHDEKQTTYLRTLTHSLQVIYWGIGIGIGLLLLIASPYLAKGWFSGSDIPVQTVSYVFIILAFTLAARWPYGLYSSGLRGMQHQVVLNGFEIFWNLSKSVGSWLVLKYISPTITAFLWYQLIITFLQTSGIFFLLWNYLPARNHPLKFDLLVLRNISRYAGGMGISAIMASLLAQLDKIVVSKMVSNTVFGYYSIANNIAMLVFSVSLPIFIAILPYFTKEVKEGNTNKLIIDFHYYAKLLSTLLLPFGIIIICNAKVVLLLWMKNEIIAEKSALILQWLMAGTLCNALMMPVHTLLLAKARIRFMLYSQVIELTCMIPLIWFLVDRFGVSGGAMGVFVLFCGYLLIQAPMIFRVTNFKQLIFNWYFKDILVFLIPLVLIATLFQKYIYTYFTESHFPILVYLAIVFMASYGISIAMNKDLIKKISSKIKIAIKK